MKYFFLSIFTSLSFYQSAYASLLDQKHWKDATAGMEEYQTEFKEACGYQLPFSFEQSSFKGWPWEEKKVDQFCGQLYHILSESCRDSKEGREAVASQIKKMDCALRADGAPEKYTLTSGSFHYTVAKESLNSQDGEWLDKHIKVAGGFTLKQVALFERNRKQIVDKLKGMNSTCETSITLDLNKDGFRNRKEDQGGTDFCGSAAETLQTFCGDESNRKKVGKIKKISCLASDKREESEFTGFKNGLLIFEVGKGRSTDSTAINQWLGKNL
jgi:hypothetical protein